MNHSDRFDRTVSEWLHADADHRVPDHLDAVLQRTRSERQRPAWSSLERWLPMDLSERRSMFPLSTSVRPIAVLLLVALLIAVVIALAVGSYRPLPAPFGQDTTYCAAVMAGSAAKEAAAGLIVALTQPDTRATWTRAGFELP